MKKFIALMIVVVLLFSTFTFGISAATTDVKTDVKIVANKIKITEKDCTVNIIYPVLSGFKAAASLNDIIQNKNIYSIGLIRNAFASIQEMKEEQKAAGQAVPNLEVAVDTNFDYNKSGNILSIMMNEYYYLGGAHGTSNIDCYTVNTKTNEIYTFNTLFNEKSNYKKVILGKLNGMIDKEKDLYFEDAKKTLAGKDTKDYQFYIDGSNLVIYFGLYDLRPYAGGIPKFTIAAKDLKGLLKDEVYSQIINAKPLKTIRLNGTSFTCPYKTYEQNYILMVPLRFFAETFGYKVVWDSKNGASVAGGYIKNNTDLYYTGGTKKTPRKLTPAKTINNRLYVPIAYFSEILNEDVNYYGEAVRLYKIAATQESQFINQIIEFIAPSSAEQCAQMFAKAVKERKGAIQYALFSDELRAAKKSYFEELNWVTGVSSPWVTYYDIKPAGKNTYDIVLHWATSAGKEPDSTIKITVQNITDQEFWHITGIQE